MLINMTGFRNTFILLMTMMLIHSDDHNYYDVVYKCKHDYDFKIVHIDKDDHEDNQSAVQCTNP